MISHQLRVLGGHNAIEEEYPFVVLLVAKKHNHFRRFCSGSAIARNWVLSASHCFQTKKNPKILFVWLRNFTVPVVESELIDVHKIFTHPGFKSLKLMTHATFNDVSLLHVAGMTVKNYGTMLATDHFTLVGLPVEYVGGGLTEMFPKANNQTTPLQMGLGVIKKCHTKEDGPFPIHIMCVSPSCSAKRQSPFKGDSGGPLLFEDKIVGVSSYVKLTNYINENTVYAPVSPFIDWMSYVMTKHG